MDNIKIPINRAGTDKEGAGMKSRPKKELLSTLGILIIAPVIAIFLTIFVFQSYQVDGPSMEGTLSHNDRLIVTKTGKTWSRITGEDYIPARYSIIVFNGSGQKGYEIRKKQLIKRTIGLPGDRVVINDGIVTVYNEANPEGFYPDKQGPESATVNTTDGDIDQTLKPGEVFVLGDNRANSLDSRAFGVVSSGDIIGTLSVRIYPLGSVKKF